VMIRRSVMPGSFAADSESATAGEPLVGSEGRPI
jgi:hypothetical protein